jgi:hypothetical protein
MTVFIRTRHSNLMLARLIQSTWSDSMSEVLSEQPFCFHVTGSLMRWLSFTPRKKVWTYQYFPSIPYILHDPPSKEMDIRGIFIPVLNPYLLTPWSGVLLEKLTSLCS